MRVLVCGGRTYDDFTHLQKTLDEIDALMPITELIHGGARGADRLADYWARSRGLTPRVFLADWDEHGKAAGPIRNQKMLDKGKPDLVIAFPGGRGTADMVSRAMKAGVVVREA